MVEVKLPAILRRHTSGEAKVTGDGATLADVLDDLDRRYPGIRAQVVTGDGELHRFVNVYLNGEDVRYLGSMEARVDEGDTIAILPAVAGG
jgi:sulfur-carrier protein